jgi:hypothetical protein
MFKNIPGLESVSLTSTLNSNSFHVSCCFISGLCCLLPLCLGIQSHLEDRPLRTALGSSNQFYFTSVASIALVIPLFLDVLFDIGNLAMSADSQSSKSRGNRTARYNFLNVFERLIILLGIVIQPLVVLVPPNTSNLALIFVCCNKCQQNWVGGTIALSLRRYDKEYFSNTFTITSLVAFSIGLIGSTFTDNDYAQKPVEKSVSFLDSLAFILTVIPCVFFFFNSSRWLILVYCRATKWSKFLFFYSKTRPPEITASTGSGDHTFFPMAYTLCGMLVLLLQCVLMGTSSRVENFTETNLFQSNLAFLVFVILVSTLSLRMVKFEVVQGLVRYCYCCVSSCCLLHYVMLQYHPFRVSDSISNFTSSLASSLGP